MEELVRPGPESYCKENRFINFPEEEFMAVFNKTPESFSIANIVAQVIGYYSFCLAVSEFLENKGPSFKNPEFCTNYLLSGFEKVFFKQLESARQKDILKTKSFELKINNDNFCADLIIKIKEADRLKFKITVSGEFKRVLIKKKSSDLKQQALFLFNSIFNSIWESFYSQVKTDNFQTKRTINTAPEYMLFSSASVTQELRRLFTAEKENLIIDLKYPLLNKNTRSGNYNFKISLDTANTDSLEGINSSQELLKKQVQNLSDGTTDVLNGILHLWLKKSKTVDDFALISIDDLLFLRGKKQNINSEGRRGGYKDKQRREIKEQIELLSKLNVSVSEMPVPWSNNGKKMLDKWRGESPVILINESDRENYFLVAPGGVLKKTLQGSGLKLGVIHKKIAEYDPYRYFWEKRIGNYLSWIWRTRQKYKNYSAPLKVESLLKEVKTEFKRPQVIRTRLENALDKLEDDGVIKSWQYEYINEEELSQKGWFSLWLEHKLIIEPPQKIIEEYSKIKNPKRL